MRNSVDLELMAPDLGLHCFIRSVRTPKLKTIVHFGLAEEERHYSKFNFIHIDFITFDSVGQKQSESEALPVFFFFFFFFFFFLNRGTRPFLGEQGNESQTTKETVEQRLFRETKKMKHEDFDFGEKGKSWFLSVEQGIRYSQGGPQKLKLRTQNDLDLLWLPTGIMGHYRDCMASEVHNLDSMTTLAVR